MAEERTFHWGKQLNVGKQGERIFQELYPEVTKTDGRINDFTLNGEGVELKTDTYSMEKTQNFFFEFYGNIEKQSIGGPWRAVRDKVKWFVYMFVKDKKVFWFDSNELVEFLDKEVKKHKLKYVKNIGYEACGYAIPRDTVKHLLKTPTEEEKNERKNR